jgi:scyllo-inositol 2-dehydrogenase (NADP+)
VIRVGLIGYGLAGALFHEPLIAACLGLELTGVLTSREHRFRVNSLDDLLDAADLIVIASPNQTHFPLATEALQRGKHVIVEKPFTVTVEEAEALASLATERERLLSVFHNRRWDGDFLTVRRVLPQLGEVKLFESNWDRFRPSIKEGWRGRPIPGAGLFNDLGPHMIDQALRLFGTPEAISADVQAQREGAKVDDYFDVTLHYGAMRVCLRSSSLIAAPRPRFAVHGTDGSFVKHGLDPQEAQLKSGMLPTDDAFGETSDGAFTAPHGTVTAVPTERGNYLAFYEAIVAAILADAPVPVPAEEAREGLVLIDLARRAAALGERLAVPAASSREG